MLMPMAFGSLIGGVVTMVGTSPNILVSKVREDITGEPFGMFDYTPVGLAVAGSGLLFLSVGYRLLPVRRAAGGSMEAAFSMEEYSTEARVPEGSAFAGRTVAELEALGEGARVATVIRERFRRFAPRPDWELRAGRRPAAAGEPEDLERVVARGRACGSRGGGGRGAEEAEATAWWSRAWSRPTRPSLGRTWPRRSSGRARARAPGGEPERAAPVAPPAALRLEVGDVLILKAPRDRLAESLGELRILPLSERDVALGRRKRSWIPLGILAAAMVMVGLELCPVAVAFAGAAALMLLLRIMTMDEAYHSIEWSVIVLLAALIPVSNAIQETGGTDLIAAGLEGVLGAIPPLAAVGLMIVIAMAITPFLNNAATVLVMAPIAASLAERLGLNPDPFLMAVAVGAACDFLTPIGHQCNTLVMGPGGYRFGDYWRLGLPLSILVVVVATPLIAMVWGLGAPG
jgi:di/tricarboxylate transporter